MAVSTTDRIDTLKRGIGGERSRISGTGALPAIRDRLLALSKFYKHAKATRVLKISFSVWILFLMMFAVRANADPAIDPLHDVRGILKAVDKALFTTDLKAPVVRVTFREGESFKKRDVLIVFDCRRQNAELASMKAQHREMAVQLEGNLYLQRRGAVGKRDLEVSRARADRAAHDARALEVRLERCIIKAPFDGRVRALAIHEHETPVAGKPILDIIGTNEIELQLIVPSVWLVWLIEGTKFTFRIDETGNQYNAQVRRIGAAVDAVSQTITVIGELLGPAPKVRAGMSGTATFPNQGG